MTSTSMVLREHARQQWPGNTHVNSDGLLGAIGNVRAESDRGGYCGAGARTVDACGSGAAVHGRRLWGARVPELPAVLRLRSAQHGSPFLIQIDKLNLLDPACDDEPSAPRRTPRERQAYKLQPYR